MSLTSALDGRSWLPPCPWLLCSRERDSVPTVYEAGWHPGTVSTGAESLDLTGTRFVDRLTRGCYVPQQFIAQYLKYFKEVTGSRIDASSFFYEKMPRRMNKLFGVFDSCT